MRELGTKITSTKITNKAYMVFHAVQFVFGGNTKGLFMVQLHFVKIIEVLQIYS